MTTTTLCRCWRLTRADGRVFAFTDHDTAITVDGTAFHPSEALTARALEQTTGLSVDNSEAMGALSDAGLTEEDILAGRFDAATIEIFEVDWSAPDNRRLLFTGEMGEIERAGGAFKAELRGLTERLNVPHGKLYQRPCRAALGDDDCRVDLDASAYTTETTVLAVDGAALTLPAMAAADGWFAHGTLRVLDEAATGLVRRIRTDDASGADRCIVLTEAIGAGLSPGDAVQISAGCDKRAATCRAKFDNMVNFRGCPHLPSEDWLFAYPQKSS
ncbi:hypothetical protein PARPLA_02865 [Rhodobacteraceae bacterium THAF1]|uniref:DUF2163 domain-containing protein n=1 Tax=Palleronia sp. THAF1 TaxID=2587842 RepID=UPI000F3C4D1F|nr:DUF2163 domain-containing protein [Palleronia sp. THAF1]QFU08267.1 hypothetical protein FIU81_06235 [Palleronia sp. THAF1]VDC28845.1 hypothetical protein PARPLA_02865 [Rhodobacteraceae bacterium THAF1]